GGRGELAVHTAGTMLEGLEGQVIKESEPSHIGLLSRSEKTTDLLYTKKQRKGTPYFRDNEKLGKVTSFLAVKATTKDDRGDLLKVIIAVLSRNEGAFDNDTRSDLHMIADITAPVLANALLHHRVNEMSRRDGLTGLLNHRVFHMVLEKGMKETDRGYIKGLAVLMVDVDNFKAINDTCGHPVGDEVLRELAGRLSGGLRELDTVARYGGEEFSVILHNLPGKQASKIAEKLRRSISAKAFKTNAGDLDLTVSIGYSLFREGDDITLQELVDRADKALYEAKRSGKNKVVGDFEIMESDNL
ncbi:MAG: GGDEF domain-containing protein, partial [bacterium]